MILEMVRDCGQSDDTFCRIAGQLTTVTSQQVCLWHNGRILTCPCHFGFGCFLVFFVLLSFVSDLLCVGFVCFCAFHVVWFGLVGWLLVCLLFCFVCFVFWLFFF